MYVLPLYKARFITLSDSRAGKISNEFSKEHVTKGDKMVMFMEISQFNADQRCCTVWGAVLDLLGTGTVEFLPRHGCLSSTFSLCCPV